jgi:septum formation protein
VALGRRILGKPADEGEAARMLRLLSGRRHRVVTAVAVGRGDRVWERAVTTAVAVKPLTEGEIAAYLATGNWRGKAGSYAIQGPFGAFIPWINGSFTGVVGLPLAETLGLLRAAGYTAGMR